MPTGVQLSVTVRGDLVRKGLQDLTDKEAPKIGRQQIRTVLERIKRRMQAYPPEPEGQSIIGSHPVLGTIFLPARGRYQRTGRLGASWRIDDTQDKKGYKISNTATGRKGRPYARYVVGNAYGIGQAYMHRKGYRGRQGWQLLRVVTEQEVQKLPQEIGREIVMVARRKGFQTS